MGEINKDQMPKITTKNFQIAGHEYLCQVWYTASDNFFLKEFPKDIERTAQITPLGSKTEEELYERYREGIERYETIIAESKKVIVFRLVAASPHFENKYSRWGNSLPKFPQGVSDFHGGNMGFTIDYEVKMLRKVGNDLFLHNIDDNDKSAGSGNKIENPDYSKIIDYTPEREAAFKELYTRFDKMLIAFIKGFFEPEKFLDSIQTTKLLQLEQEAKNVDCNILNQD